jgi:hypothetical protein
MGTAADETAIEDSFVLMSINGEKISKRYTKQSRREGNIGGNKLVRMVLLGSLGFSTNAFLFV